VESDHLNAYSSVLILSIEDEGGRRGRAMARRTPRSQFDTLYAVV
jgi:hypothetical protein